VHGHNHLRPVAMHAVPHTDVECQATKRAATFVSMGHARVCVSDETDSE